MSAQTYLQAAAELARTAGRNALTFFRGELSVESKADGSPVTVADKSTEQLARRWIEDRFPDDSILGEEFGAAARGRRRWIIDPIDGTKSFVRGVPLWGTLVAVADGDDVIAGAAFFPVLDEIIVAAPGEGAWWNDARAQVSGVETLSRAAVLCSDLRLPQGDRRRDRFAELTERAGITRTWGDCYGYLLVATGRAEVMLDVVVSAWDTAAVFPIITEAGGVFTDWNGRVTAFGGSAIATNGALASETRCILGAKNGAQPE